MFFSVCSVFIVIIVSLSYHELVPFAGCEPEISNLGSQPQLGISELWNNGVWEPALKDPNGIWAYFDRPGTKTTICKINNFSIVTRIC